MRFPAGFEVRIRDDVRLVDGRLLVGGSPLRAVRLTDAALDLLDGRSLTVTGPLADTLAARLVDGNIADPVLTGSGADPTALTARKRTRLNSSHSCASRMTSSA